MGLHPAPLVGFIRWVTDAYGLILLVRVLLSWLRLPEWHPISRTVGRFCVALTEPLLRPIRRWLEPYQRGSGFDFSPVVLYLLIIVARAVIERGLIGVSH
ncbi:MAG: YggT family protein [Armatimonadetes bacterium]|nr:YggT family protein [Armatimonadota bacterium]